MCHCEHVAECPQRGRKRVAEPSLPAAPDVVRLAHPYLEAVPSPDPRKASNRPRVLGRLRRAKKIFDVRSRGEADIEWVVVRSQQRRPLVTGECRQPTEAVSRHDVVRPGYAHARCRGRDRPPVGPDLAPVVGKPPARGPQAEERVGIRLIADLDRDQSRSQALGGGRGRPCRGCGVITPQRHREPDSPAGADRESSKPVEIVGGDRGGGARWECTGLRKGRTAVHAAAPKAKRSRSERPEEGHEVPLCGISCHLRKSLGLEGEAEEAFVDDRSCARGIDPHPNSVRLRRPGQNSSQSQRGEPDRDDEDVSPGHHPTNAAHICGSRSE